jgi:conjugative relaxase-like TrwC/TraI family protein
VLSISSPAGASAVRYYAELAQDGYYTQRCEAPGVWHGSGVKALGLEGEASPEQIENILKGFSPDGESKLVQNAGAENRKLGVDLTFSASKSVSCVWGLLDEQERETISEAHEKAVRDTIDWLEQEGGIITRRGSGGSVHEEAQPVCVIYEHGTSRNLDPQLHTHALVMNACVRQDGTTGAIRANSES